MTYSSIVSASILTCLLVATGCQDHRNTTPPAPQITTVATGLVAPISVENDASGRLWVSELGTGKNDARVSVVLPDGRVFPVFTDFPSTPQADGEISGLDHLLIADGILYILDQGILYKADIAGYQPGQPAVRSSALPTENIKAFVLTYRFVANPHDSHPYSMAVGPDGAFHIADAAANAILRRSKTGEYSVLTEVPGITNPTPVGPPQIESVPTGIAYDGQKFLISTLLGFPFPAGKALLYQMDLTGKLSVYQQGFNSLVDINTDAIAGPLALEYGQFGPKGFVAKTGRLLRAQGTSSTVVRDSLNLPTDLKVLDAHTAYLTTMGDGSLKKITY